jgi:excisionase family DNA binding protein
MRSNQATVITQMPKYERFSEYTRRALIESGVLTITIEEAGRFIGLGRGAAYECVRNGEIPSLALGRKRLVPVPALLRMLGEAE